MDDMQSLIEELRFGAENGADAELLERAADKIQELVADLGDADAMTEYWMKKNKWISVKDRLPEESGNYLVCDVPYKIMSVVAYSARWERFNCYDTFTEEYVNEQRVYEVTHWMPLPDAPEVDE